VRERRVSSLLAPAIFGGTVLTHLAGGSAGKEGAALQLGGSIAAFLSKVFRLNEEDQHLLVCAGMGAFFSALFGTPLGAFLFVLEVLHIGRQCLKSALPALLSSLVAFGIAGLCGAHWERFSFRAPALDWLMLGKGLAVVAAASVAAWIFCHALHRGEHLAKKIISNDYLRIALGGVFLILFTVLVGSYDYNGGGMQIIEGVFEGTVRPEAFALKMLFTVLTVSAGYKGGEIVPSLFIGATLGGTMALFLGLPMGFASALGMMTFLSAVTNCPLAVALIALEMFGGCGWPYLAFAALLGYALTYRISLYSYPNNKKTEG
jgi:H+/Cl- antiporter ClcA